MGLLKYWTLVRIQHTNSLSKKNISSLITIMIHYSCRTINTIIEVFNKTITEITKDNVSYSISKYFKSMNNIYFKNCLLDHVTFHRVIRNDKLSEQLELGCREQSASARVTGSMPSTPKIVYHSNINSIVLIIISQINTWSKSNLINCFRTLKLTNISLKIFKMMREKYSCKWWK